MFLVTLEVYSIFCSNCLFFHRSRYQVIGVLVTLEWSKYFVQFFLYEHIPGNWCFWSLLKFIKYFVQIGLLIWTYTRSLVFLVTLEFSKYFVLFYMNMYQVIGVFGHSWSLFNILFKLFFSIWAYTRSLVFLVTHEFSKYFIPGHLCQLIIWTTWFF